MLEIAKITYRSFGKVRSKDFVIPNQSHFFGDYDCIKKVCIEDCICDDFVVLGIDFKKVEVFQ